MVDSAAGREIVADDFIDECDAEEEEEEEEEELFVSNGLGAGAGEGGEGEGEGGGGGGGEGRRSDLEKRFKSDSTTFRVFIHRERVASFGAAIMSLIHK